MTDRTGTNVTEASIWVDASPAEVWQNVANIANLGRHSPETHRVEWLPGSDGHRVGARFRGYNRNDRHEWHTDCEITEFTAPAEFAFDVAPQGQGPFSTRWRYTLAADGPGSLLTESFESPVLEARPAEMNPDRHRVLVDMLEATLANIKAEVESAQAAD